MHRLSSEQRIRVYAELWPAHPRWGLWAWWAQRASGVLLIAYVAWHVVTVVGSVDRPERLAAMMRFLRHPVIVAILLSGTVYHAANGVRLVLFDLGIDAMRRPRTFWAFLAAGTLVVLAGFSRVVR